MAYTLQSIQHTPTAALHVPPHPQQAALEASAAKVAELTAQLQAASANAEDVKALRQRAQLVEEELADANTKLEVQHKVMRACVACMYMRWCGLVLMQRGG